MRAAFYGAMTALGTILSILAVYNNVRLDWAETALVAGMALFVSGVLMLGEIIKDIERRTR